jgi:hypothetical protein
MYRQYQLIRIQNKLCFDCGASCDNETLRCTPCKEKASVRARGANITKYRDARLRKVCLNCGVASEKARCQTCYEKVCAYTSKETKAKAQNALSLRREQANLCVYCGLVPPFIGNARCTGCLIKINEKCRKSREKKLLKVNNTNTCMSCELPRVGSANYCLKHYINHKVKSSLKGYSATLIPDLIEKAVVQDMKCILTGVPLIPGDNMSLDHIKPQVKYPELTNEISNLVWVDLAANRAKRETSMIDYIKQCEAIVARKESLLALDASVQSMSTQEAAFQ